MIILRKDLLDDLIERCKREYPNEACGILSGKNSRGEKIYNITNTDKSRATFFMDPREQLRVMKEIRNSGLEMLAIYHSHPFTQAYPSARDVELAYYPKCEYVIISFNNPQAPEMRSFRIIGDNIIKERIDIER